MFFSGKIDNTDENVIGIYDIKSGMSFFAFFLVIYVFGKCILKALEYLWGWIVLSLATYLFFAPSTNNKLVEKLQDLSQSI